VPELREEWPLVFFTALAPASVGAGVVFSSIFKQHHLDPTIFPASLTLFGILAAAFAVSSAHIAHKRRMPRAIRNLFRSWLSREIFLLLASCLLYLAAAGMYFFRDKYSIEPRFITYAFWLASGVGIFGVLSMQRVYTLRSVRPWTTLRAISMLIASAFLLGTMVVLLLLYIFADKYVEDMLWRLFPVFFGPLLLDVLQLYELKRLRLGWAAFFLGCTRLPVYLTVFHFLGRVEIVRLVAVMVLALAGDIVLRLFFFAGQITSFHTEMDRARHLRKEKT
jgi:DMSO reductase anchor subunit